MIRSVLDIFWRRRRRVASCADVASSTTARDAQQNLPIAAATAADAPAAETAMSLATDIGAGEASEEISHAETHLRSDGAERTAGDSHTATSTAASGSDHGNEAGPDHADPIASRAAADAIAQERPAAIGGAQTDDGLVDDPASDAANNGRTGGLMARLSSVDPMIAESDADQSQTHARDGITDGFADDSVTPSESDIDSWVWDSELADFVPQAGAATGALEAPAGSDELTCSAPLLGREVPAAAGNTNAAIEPQDVQVDRAGTCEPSAAGMVEWVDTGAGLQHGDLATSRGSADPIRAAGAIDPADLALEADEDAHLATAEATLAGLRSIAAVSAVATGESLAEAASKAIVVSVAEATACHLATAAGVACADTDRVCVDTDRARLVSGIENAASSLHGAPLFDQHPSVVGTSTWHLAPAESDGMAECDRSDTCEAGSHDAAGSLAPVALAIDETCIAPRQADSGVHSGQATSTGPMIAGAGPHDQDTRTIDRTGEMAASIATSGTATADKVGKISAGDALAAAAALGDMLQLDVAALDRAALQALIEVARAMAQQAKAEEGKSGLARRPAGRLAERIATVERLNRPCRSLRVPKRNRLAREMLRTSGSSWHPKHRDASEVVASGAHLDGTEPSPRQADMVWRSRRVA
jgi:hypothetical protein